MSKSLGKRDQLIFGGLFVAVGLGIMAMITFSPEGLNVPYWLGMVAAATFAFAGASVMAQGLGWGGFGRLLGLLTVLCLAAPGLWIMLDPGDKQCSGSVGIGGFSIGSNDVGDFMCRAVFGFGGALTLVFAVFSAFALIRYLRQRKKDRQADGVEAPRQ